MLTFEHVVHVYERDMMAEAEIVVGSFRDGLHYGEQDLGCAVEQIQEKLPNLLRFRSRHLGDTHVQPHVM